MENLRVYLLGGNSVIGQAICGGVLEKFGNYNNDSDELVALFLRGDQEVNIMKILLENPLKLMSI